MFNDRERTLKNLAVKDSLNEERYYMLVQNDRGMVEVATFIAIEADIYKPVK